MNRTACRDNLDLAASRMKGARMTTASDYGSEPRSWCDARPVFWFAAGLTLVVLFAWGIA